MNNRVVKIATDPDPQRTETMEGVVSGVLLLLATIASAAMVWTRLQAGVDQPTFDEMLAAIDENLVWHQWHGTMRILFGGLLIAAGSLVKPAMASAQGWQLRISVALLNLGGIAMVISGVLVIFVGSVYWTEIYDVEQLDRYRALAGSVGNTIIGLAIILMAPVQWRLGGMMKLLGCLAPPTGLGMVIVWWDSSSVHQISGVLFLVWMLGTSASLIFGWFGVHKNSRDFTNTDQTHRFQVDDVK